MSRRALNFGPPRVLVKHVEEQMRETRGAVVCALSQLLDLKDLNTGVHSTRLAEWAVRIGERLDLSEEDLSDIEVAALAHDIGKIGIPDCILQKPDRLTAEEESIVRKHPEYGWGVLHLIPGLERASLIVLHHHERVDGAGYPSGLRGEEIPIGARIVSVLDAFDAMVSARCYRPGLDTEEALRRLAADSGTQFDSRIVELFFSIVDLELPQISLLAQPQG